MKKLDKLILSSFLGPFFLTFLVVVFILLTQHMLKYFDDIVGKDLGWDVLAQLFFYFAVFMTPIAIPLAVLLSSLMTFGNLGEHFELTAIKSAGISLLRALLPIFVFVLGLTVLAYYSNNYFVPKAALEAYSLLYDIKQKKPALDLKEGTFYNGIPDFSIKVNKKHDDGHTIEDVIIYDHRNQNGNKNVTLADSGAMYTIHNDRYLKLVLFRGHSYEEGSGTSKSTTNKKETFRRAQFAKSEFVLDLSSFGLDRTDKDLFKGNRIMRNLSQLRHDVDSVGHDIMEKRLQVYAEVPYAFYYHLRDDSIQMPKELKEFKAYNDSLNAAKERLELAEKAKEDSIKQATPKEEKPMTTDQKEIKAHNERLESAKQDAKPVKKPADEEKQQTPRSVAEPKKIVVGKGKPEPENKQVPPKVENMKDAIARADAKKMPEKRVLNDADRAKLRADSDKKVVKIEPQKIIPTQEDDDGGAHPEIRTRQQEKEKDTVKTKTKADIVQELMTKEDDKDQERELQSALNMVRQTKSKLQTSNQRIERLTYEQDTFDVQWHKILANSMACIIMFLIGAPLGAIIKRGGLGIPVLVSIIFFIIFYVISMMGEKWAKQDMIEPFMGMWAANALLLPIGLFFLRQARNDARLFESDFYSVMIDKFKTWFGKRKKTKPDKQ
ncbi:LptF/LptG family permease [Fulvivirga kasyanovii]|uniref:LptF/LptG family permease n=1 Tax=Fulvivirga kasyanovii TaxID=396812 RepID=A0ABW9RHS1_9BACT|nr:LptF/LptG family permease [Fulvivirga kasyanovii]MTI23604.1 LptF/LptG family permease [Fulvivirga kasyanovii]